VPYIVWIEDGVWKPSPELDNLADVLIYLVNNADGARYEITKKVDVQLIETPKPTMGMAGTGMMSPPLPGPC
jgi:hypothetical protein